MGWRVCGTTGMVPRRKSAPNSMNRMPRCAASSPSWLAFASSTVGVPNQIAIVSSCALTTRGARGGLLAVLLADAAVRLAERDALAGDQRVRLFGGVDRGVEFDLVRAETHAVDSDGHDRRGGERHVDAAEQRRLDELQV